MLVDSNYANSDLTELKGIWGGGMETGNHELFHLILLKGTSSAKTACIIQFTM